MDQLEQKTKVINQAINVLKSSWVMSDRGLDKGVLHREQMRIVQPFKKRPGRTAEFLDVLIAEQSSQEQAPQETSLQKAYGVS